MRFEELMTYHHEHTADLETPGTFAAYRRSFVAPGIHRIDGLTSASAVAPTPIAYRFDAGSFTPERAIAYLAANGITAPLVVAQPSGTQAVRLVGLSHGVSTTPLRDTPVVRIDAAKRSNDIPDGALGVYLFASSEEIDSYRTRIMQPAIRGAIPTFLSNRINLDDGTIVYQGPVRAQHDPLQPIGYVRKIFEYPQGFLALTILPACSRSYQEQVRDRVLVGGSMGFDPLEWTEPGTDGAVADITKIYWLELSLVDAPSTPGTDIQALEQRAKQALGLRSRWFRGATLPSPVVIHEIIELPPSEDSASEVNNTPEAPDKPTAERVDPLLATTDAPTSDEFTLIPTNNQEVGMTYPESNGFIWVDLRPEADFLPETLRYGMEDLATGIILRGGRLLKSLVPDWSEGLAVQRVGFNLGTGGWTQEQVADFMMSGNRSWWWESQGTALPDMPQARAKIGTTLTRIAHLVGFGRTPQERAQRITAEPEVKITESQPPSGEVQGAENPPITELAAEPGSEVAPLKESDDMTEEQMKALLDAQDARFAERITAAVKPIGDQVAALETRMTQPVAPPTPQTPTGAGAAAATIQTPTHHGDLPSQIRSKHGKIPLHVRDLVKR